MAGLLPDYGSRLAGANNNNKRWWWLGAAGLKEKRIKNKKKSRAAMPCLLAKQKNRKSFVSLLSGQCPVLYYILGNSIAFILLIYYICTESG